MKFIPYIRYVANVKKFTGEDVQKVKLAEESSNSPGSDNQGDEIDHVSENSLVVWENGKETKHEGTTSNPVFH